MTPEASTVSPSTFDTNTPIIAAEVEFGDNPSEPRSKIGSQAHQKALNLRMNHLQDQQNKSRRLQYWTLLTYIFTVITILLLVGDYTERTTASLFFFNKNSSKTHHSFFVDRSRTFHQTSTKLVELPLHRLSSQKRELEIGGKHQRWLEDTTNLACNEYYNTLDNFTFWNQTEADDGPVSGVRCEPIGQITYDDAATLYQQFCPSWPFPEGTENPNCDVGSGAVEEVLLTCNNRKTRVLGGEYFPDGGFPAFDGQYTIFPTPSNPSIVANYYFTARQLIPDPSGTSVKPCMQEFQMKLYCQEGTEKKCLVFSTVSPENQCAGSVDLCPSSSGGSQFSNGRDRGLRG